MDLVLVSKGCSLKELSNGILFVYGDMAQEKEGMFQLLKVEKNGFLQLHRIYMLITVHISHQKPWLLNPL
jgi:hypothetical protein